ncbi:MAG: hypothetical protein HY287_16335 [Planctomycetes bacterium]|nr:hypothetical protein [Planctomycetota bacterium]MBI3835895.1 hypothetical protein [Planctomycetota bacterium]
MALVSTSPCPPGGGGGVMAAADDALGFVIAGVNPCGPNPIPPGPPPPPPPPCPIVPGHCCDPTCRTCPPNDCDADGIPDDQDPDMDGDGYANEVDPDTDGDGIPNNLDDDDDNDGIPDWDDPSPRGCSQPCCNNPQNNPLCPEYVLQCAPTNACCDDGWCGDDADCTINYCDTNTGHCVAACPGGVVAQGCGLPFSVDLWEITFRGNVQLFRDSSYEEAGDYGWRTGYEYKWVDWRWDQNPDHAVCYPAGQDMAMIVRLHVSGNAGSTGQLSVVGPDGINGQADFTLSCGTHTVDVNIETTHTPYLIDAYEPMTLNWYVRESAGDEWAAVGTTQHNVYVTYDWPAGSEPTKRRLSWVCNQAEGIYTSNEGDIVDAIHDALNDNPPYDGKDQGIQLIDDWRLLIFNIGSPPHKYSGECDQQAHLMNLALEMLGITYGNEYKTRASTDGNIFDQESKTAAQLGYTVDLDGNGVVGDEVFELVFDFPQEEHLGVHFWNNFEGSLETPVGYYAVWPSLKADNPFELYCKITDQFLDGGPHAKQYWVLRWPNGNIRTNDLTEVPRAPVCP